MYNETVLPVVPEASPIVGRLSVALAYNDNDDQTRIAKSSEPEKSRTNYDGEYNLWDNELYGLFLSSWPTLRYGGGSLGVANGHGQRVWRGERAVCHCVTE